MMDPTTRSAGSNVALLRQVPLFAELDEASLEILATHSRRRRFGANETLFHEGDPGYTLYVVISGRVRIQQVTPSGELVHIASRGRGETVGEMALIDGKARMADAATAEPTDLLILDRSDFVRCLEKSPRMALGIMACLADRIRQAADQVKRLQSQDVLGRVCSVLLELAEADGAAASPARITITQQELADQVGTTRESVNRALSRLRRQGALEVDGRTLTLLDPERLRGNAERA
jgi:CRP/FNR family transcriptional regulator, cyclic AMP receptor protein